jgi:hypothetical protein
LSFVYFLKLASGALLLSNWLQRYQIIFWLFLASTKVDFIVKKFTVKQKN